MTYDNTKSHKRPGFEPLFRRYIFQKTIRKMGGQIDAVPLPVGYFGVNATLFFSHGSSNSCGALIGFLRQFDINVLNQMCENRGSILILNVTIYVKNFFLINLYNPNIENEQVEVL